MQSWDVNPCPKDKTYFTADNPPMQLKVVYESEMGKKSWLLSLSANYDIF